MQCQGSHPFSLYTFLAGGEAQRQARVRASLRATTYTDRSRASRGHSTLSFGACSAFPRVPPNANGTFFR